MTGRGEAGLLDLNTVGWLLEQYSLKTIKKRRREREQRSFKH
jgi:hypothetical protein